VIYLLDADTLITSDRTYYPPSNFALFWAWLAHEGACGSIKMPKEQFNEVVAGKGELVEWLKTNKKAMLLDEVPDPAIVQRVLEEGYGPSLTAEEIATIGLDPFAVAYALLDPANRSVVTFEVSRPSKQRANQKLPDVCRKFGIIPKTMFDVIKELGFSTAWTAH
jgi:hypothetical protein